MRPDGNDAGLLGGRAAVMTVLHDRSDWPAALVLARRLSPRIPDEIWLAVGAVADRVGVVPLAPRYLQGLARHIVDRRLRGPAKDPSDEPDPA